MSKPKLAVIGLGYVGLPLAIRFANAGFDVTGVDTNERLLTELTEGVVVNRDIPSSLFPIPYMKLSTQVPDDCTIYFVCVPTPFVNASYQMDARAIKLACKSIGQVIPDGSSVVIESTVTPGSTNGILRDEIRNAKGDDKFYMAFSPERVNPGPTYMDYERINNTKLVGCDQHIRVLISDTYRKIYPWVEILSLEVAELVKVFENAQRDANIALMNELAIECYQKAIPFSEVIRGLRTKKSSPMFSSGLVGGHCIAIDPYFLASYYESGYSMILKARAKNEEYIDFVTRIAQERSMRSGPIVISGRSYKPGVTDTRNSGSLKIYNRLHEMGEDVMLHDTLLDPEFDDRTPSVLLAAVNHDKELNLFNYYNCDKNTTVIVIGDQFEHQQYVRFENVIHI